MIRIFLQTADDKLRSFVLRHARLLIAGLSFLLIMAFKIKYVADYGRTSVDYVCMHEWFTALRENGGILGLGSIVTEHGTAYKLLLALLTYLPVEPLPAIYGANLFFDLLLALVCGLFVRDFAPPARKAARENWLLVSVCVLMLPNLLISTLRYAQNDSIYMFFVVLAGYLYRKGRLSIACAAFAAAVLFKSLPLMLLPFAVLLWMDGKLRVRHFLLTVAAVFLFSLPNLLVSGSFDNTFVSFVYGQGPTAAVSKMFNFYALFLFLDIEIGHMQYYGLILTFLLLAIPAVLINRRRLADRSGYLGIFLLEVIYVTYFMPGMHGRYDLLACVAAVLWWLHRGEGKDIHLPLAVNLYSALVSVQRLNHYIMGSADFTNQIFVAVSFAYLAYILYLPRLIFARRDAPFSAAAA